MTVIVIEGFAGDADLYADQYQRLSEDLAAAGHSVTLREPFEQKSIGGAAQEVAFHILENLDAYVEGAIIATAVNRLRGRAKSGPRKGSARRATIYGPNGEELKSWDLPAGDTEDTDS